MRNSDWERQDVKRDVVKRQRFLHKRRIKRQGKYVEENGPGTIVLIDGASLYHMGENLGIGAFRMPQLYKIFAKDLTVGSWLEAYFVIPFCKLWQMIDEIKDAKFIPILVAMDHPKDDGRFIIKELQSICADRVQRIILVSTNGDFVPYLAEKKREGVEIIVVATHALDAHTGNHSLARNLCEGFPFIELKDYRSHITGKAWSNEREY